MVGKKFWLNGKLLQEDGYFIEFKKNLAKQSEEVSPYRPPRVEYLTAEEIENLINGAGIVSIVEYKEPEMLSNDTTVGGIVYLADSLIRVQSQIQTNAFPLEYKGFGIGIYFTETGCPKTSYLNTTLYEQGNTPFLRSKCPLSSPKSGAERGLLCPEKLPIQHSGIHFLSE